MTIFFPDVANYQSGLIIQPGTVAVTAKSTEGTYYIDRSYAGFKAQAASVGAIFWAYHFLTQGNAAAQADYCFNVVGPGVPVMLDVEPIPAQKSNPTVADIRAFATRYRQRGGRVCLAYIPRWYWQQLGEPDLTALNIPIVASGYPGGYSDTDANWNAYGGVKPAIWQYTNAQPYGGMSVDFNAFPGTTAQLAALIRGDNTMAVLDATDARTIWAYSHGDNPDVHQTLDNAAAWAGAASTKLDQVLAHLAIPSVDPTALAQALAPLLIAGTTADQLAEAVVQHLATLFANAKG